ncbi:transaldolase [Conchiformibius kuhniae]|uniref:Transaldolase n=1 Tax=Conchiformibius kuhniae TaxID=211502 RepID=A0A8T9MWZ5_9NEIS|nr:transaldolase [Conchiformibius kuhniae]
MSILAEVKKLGQHIWLDNLSRSLLQQGTLADWLAQGVSGVTSNPAIFQKAFATDPLYAADIAALKAQGKTAVEIYETLAVADVRAACDLLRPEFEASGGQGGWVSLEVSPELAHDAGGTVADAQRLHTAIDRPNAMMKIPATEAGIAAVRELAQAGISINVTLLFAHEQIRRACTAYREGIAARLAAGLPADGVQMVASFFISRIDAALDAQLPEALRGKTAIALAKTAYRDWQHHTAAPEWSELRARGANPPRLLWASTGVKNPAYPATLYVDELIGEHTVNTVPDATLAAFTEHGTARAALTENTDEAAEVLAQVRDTGADLDALAARLQTDGLKQFEEAFAKLLAELA